MENVIKSKEFVGKLQQIVTAAGEIVIGFLGKEHKYTGKSDGSFATEVDILSENFLIDKLSSLLPEAAIWAEESGKDDIKGKDYHWIIDPIDGTTNFSHGFPYFAVSVALTYKSEPIVGVTYNPVSKELFYASKGRGAYLNGKAIFVSKREDMGRSLVSMAIPCRKQDYFEFQELTLKVQDNICTTIRKLGSACLDLANVACGRLDASFLKYVSWWDIAAGILLVREAGGFVSEFGKDTISPEFSSCIASNKNLYNGFKKLLN